MKNPKDILQELKKVFMPKPEMDDLIKFSVSNIKYLLKNHPEYYKSTCIKVALNRSLFVLHSSIIGSALMALIACAFLCAGTYIMYIIIQPILNNNWISVLSNPIIWRIILGSVYLIAIGLIGMKFFAGSLPDSGVKIEVHKRHSNLLKNEKVEQFELGQVEEFLKTKQCYFNKIYIDKHLESEKILNESIDEKIEKHAIFIKDKELLKKLI